MIPPSSSFTHAIHKITPAARAAISALQAMPVPPPAYTTNPPPVLILDPESDISSTTSTTPSLSDWTAPPVKIHVNASIHIEGTLNQVALPPHPSSRPLRVIGDNLRAASGSVLDYLGSPSVSADRLACDRAEQITDAMLSALRDAGVLVGTVTPMRALEVDVDASVTVKGERNVLTTNVPLRDRARAPGSGTGRGSTPETPGPLLADQGTGVQGGGLGPSASMLLPHQANTRTVQPGVKGVVEQEPSASSMVVDAQTRTNDGNATGDPTAMDMDVDTQSSTADGEPVIAKSWEALLPRPTLASPTTDPVPAGGSVVNPIAAAYPQVIQEQEEVPMYESGPRSRMKRKRTGTHILKPTSYERDGGGETNEEGEMTRQKMRGRRAGVGSDDSDLI